MTQIRITVYANTPAALAPTMRASIHHAAREAIVRAGPPARLLDVRLETDEQPEQEQNHV